MSPKKHSTKESPKMSTEAAAPQDRILYLPLGDIQIIPDPLRDSLPKAEMEKAVFDMAESIRELGLISPLAVNAATEGSGYELVAGRIRLAAAALLEWESVPCVIKNYDAVHSELAMYSENIVRTGYTPAGFDQAMARYGDLYLQLHPETAPKVAGGKASAAKRAEKAEAQAVVEGKPSKKVSSKAPAAPVEPPKPSFTQTVADKLGVSTRTVEKARKRGKSFTPDDFEVFEKKGVSQEQQDKIAAITDAAKRLEVISLIHGGAQVQKAFDAVLLPPGAKTEDVGTNEAIAGPKSDEEWLAEFPIRSKVTKARFDAHALFYRRTSDVLAKLNVSYKKSMKEFGKLATGAKGYPAIVHRFLSVNHPGKWKVCGTCGGLGMKDGKVCGDCDMNGFTTH